jgi:hypothetical protein
MSSGVALTIAILVMIWRAIRQRETRRLRPLRQRKIMWLLGFLTVAPFIGVTAYPSPGTSTVVVFGGVVALCAVAATSGALRAFTVRVWRSPAGEALRQGTTATTIAWVVWCAVHVGLDVWLTNITGAAIGNATLYAGLFLSLTAQGVVLRNRLDRTPIEP